MRDFNNKTYYEDRLNALGLSKKSVRVLHSDDFKRLGDFLKEQERVVNNVSYNMISNHFHFILQQLQDDGISNLMHKLGTSYTNCFNKKNERSGALFQGPYKAIHIDNEKYLLWLIGYINGNIEIHGLGKASDYPWSSYSAIRKELRSFLNKEASGLSNLSVLSGLDIIKSQFASVEQFEEFVKMVIEDSRKNKEMRKYLLEH